jgi:hypothetical protein
MDVIQTYIELLRKDVHLDDGLLSELKNQISAFDDLVSNTKLDLAEGLRNKCQSVLSITTASENPSQNFMHEMVKKLCDYFEIRIKNGNNNDALARNLYLFLRNYDQLLLPILEQLKSVNQTPEGKEMIKHLNLNDDLISDYYTWKKRNTTRPMLKSVISNKLYTQAEAAGNTGLSVIGNKQFKVNGGRRTRHKRSGKSGHKRSGKSGHKRSGKSGHKRSVHKSRRR